MLEVLRDGCGCERKGDIKLNSPVLSLLGAPRAYLLSGGLFDEMWKTAGRSGLGGVGTEVVSLRSKWGLSKMSRRMFSSSNQVG